MLQAYHTHKDVFYSSPDTVLADKYFEQASIHFKDALYDSSYNYFQNEGALNEKDTTGNKYIEYLNTIGEEHFKANRMDSAMFYFRRSIVFGIAQHDDSSLEIARAYHHCGVISDTKGLDSAALYFHKKALELRLTILGKNNLDVADSYGNIGKSLFYIGDYLNAIDNFHTALSIQLAFLGERHIDVAQCYYYLGRSYEERGYTDTALDYHQKALSIRLALFGENHKETAKSYHSLGNMYNNRWQHDLALQYFHKSLSIRLNLFGEKHTETAWSYNNIGITYFSMNNFDDALKYFEKALSIRLEVQNGISVEIGGSYYNIGSTYYAKHDYISALNFHHKAVDIWNKCQNAAHPKFARLYNEIGMDYLDLGDYHNSLIYFHKALSIQLNVYKEHNIDVGITYQNISSVFFKQDSIMQALMYIQKAIGSLKHKFHGMNIYVNPDLNEISNNYAMTLFLEQKAKILTRKYDIEKQKKLKDLLCALNAYELTSHLINIIGRSYQTEGSHVRLRERFNTIYGSAIANSLHLYRITGQRMYKNKAFAFSEKSKSAVLRQALSESYAKQFSGIPKFLLEKERNLKTDLAIQEKAVFEEEAKGSKASRMKINQLRNTLCSLYRQKDSLTHQFEHTFPEYFNLKYKTPTISLKKIQNSLLKEDQVLIEYFVGDKSIHAFTVTNRSLDIHSIIKDSLFDYQVTTLKEGLVKRDYSLYTKNAFLLYQKLIEPFKSIISSKDIIIIPDGILGYIPFETLLTKEADTAKKDYRQLSYLIKENQITYDYSATLLQENVISGKKKNADRYIGFAPTIYK